ncbi:MAG: PQQ-dependent sugar dehydrogenase [Tepidisphaerales bacterium]
MRTLAAWSLAAVAGVVIGLGIGTARPAAGQTARELYATHCANCHGADLNGGGAGSLIDGNLQFGSDRMQVFRRIKWGIEELGMPAYEPLLSDEQIWSLVSLMEEEAQARPEARRRGGDVVETEHHTYRIETVVPEGQLVTPWAIAWTGPNEALITERPGRLRVWRNGQLLPEPVRDIPRANEHGQGGLMEVAVDPDFATKGWVYLGYTHQAHGGRQTRIVRGRIVDNRWTDEQVLWEARPEHYTNSGLHFGTRITFDGRGNLFFAIGDRGVQNQAQDLTRPNGKVHRITTDGRIPSDNPFVGQAGVYESIYSYGNRNPQGLVVHPETGLLWSTEHGPMGGDELNWIRPGMNYGWPVITYGRNYNGTIISNLTHKEGMEQPAFQWTPSIAVCGLDVYRGEKFPAWRGQLLVGALAFEEVRRVEVTADGRAGVQEVILKNRGRVRDVRVGPDGLVYVVLNRPDMVVRLVPQ